MTGEPLPAECAEVRRHLAEGDADREVLDHLADCQGCSALAAALVELEARLAQLPPPEPPAGAADRAIARFRAQVAAQAVPGTAPIAGPSAASQRTATPAPPSRPPSPPAGSAPPSQAPPGRPPRAGHARRRRWPAAVSLAAGAAAAIVLLVALVVVLEPASTPPAYAAILHEAAVQTGAQKSARMDLTGAIGLSLHGQNVTTPLSGTGATQFPDRGELTEVATIFGTPLRQDIVSVGDSVWTRVNGGQWAYVPIPPDHASPIDQALAYPAQALDDLSRVGSGYRSLGNTTLSDGTRVRQIRLVIPGGAFHAFGYLSEQVSQWSVSVDVTQSSHVLRQLTISGRGVVSVLGIRVPFTYDLRLALSHFGVRVSIHSPAGAPSPRPGRTVSPATTPSGRTASSTVAARSTPTPSASTRTSPAPKPSSSSPSPCPSGTHSAARLPAKPTPAPTCASAR